MGHIILDHTPRNDPISYYNQKGRYCLNLQIICDPHKCIRTYHIGQLGITFCKLLIIYMNLKVTQKFYKLIGKVHDSRVHQLMPIYQTPQAFFDHDQFIIGDPAYQLTTTTITPFRNGPRLTAELEKFNKLLSKIRIVIEHVNGCLKSRWASLRGL